MPAPENIRQLVQRFDQHREAYRSGKYNETQLRCADDLDRVRNLERHIAQVDAEIDQRVYALYGSTEDEIQVVEGKAP